MRLTTRKLGKSIIPLATTMALALAGCTGQGDKQTGGTLVGAAAGALLGSQFGSGKGKLVSTALGTLAGAYLGNTVGKSLDNADRAAMQKSTQYSLETAKDGRMSNWNNPNSGNSGSIMPTNTYQAPSGEYCREYQQTITVGGRTEKAYGTACRQPDKTWKIRN